MVAECEAWLHEQVLLLTVHSLLTKQTHKAKYVSILFTQPTVTVSPADTTRPVCGLKPTQTKRANSSNLAGVLLTHLLSEEVQGS